jgi:hypothetical protein
LARRRFLNSARHSPSARLQGKSVSPRPRTAIRSANRRKEAERVLRIGIDVQANELVTTNENDRAHLVFHDGSSLTANARLTIDRFVLDPSTKTGELAINASRGVLPLVGGKIIALALDALVFALSLTVVSSFLSLVL